MDLLSGLPRPADAHHRDAPRRGHSQHRTQGCSLARAKVALKSTVRRAGAEDIGALVLLMHDFYSESGFELDHGWAESSFRSLLASPALGAVWVAHAGLEPVGHAVLSVRFAMEFGALIGYIDDLYVKPSFRAMGAGRALVEALYAECRARACESVQVEVGESNAPALALYSRFGLMSLGDGRVLLSGAPAPKGCEYE